jgi:hypothetical protein
MIRKLQMRIKRHRYSFNKQGKEARQLSLSLKMMISTRKRNLHFYLQTLKKILIVKNRLIFLLSEAKVTPPIYL